MDLLQSPPESLAFRYSAVLLGSVWAWLAVLFAALGLWRARSVGSSINSDPQPEFPEQPTVPVGPAENKSPVRAFHVEGGDGSSPKGRFTAYFHVEDNGDASEEEEGGDGVSDVDSEGVEEERPLWKWDVGLGLTGARIRGDLGLYRYQDLTALDGSVVRLWDRDREFRRRRV